MKSSWPMLGFDDVEWLEGKGVVESAYIDSWIECISTATSDDMDSEPDCRTLYIPHFVVMAR